MSEQTELHIYRGIQGSGKTTLAKTLALLDGGRVVGRDHIRRMLGFEGLGTKKQEDEVTQIQTRLIHGGLRAGQNVHVDDMNLKAVYVKRLMGIAEYFDARVVWHDLARVPLETCLARNAERSVGRLNQDVIKKNWERFIKPLNGGTLPIPEKPEFDTKYLPFEPYKAPEGVVRNAVLIDIDGTVALHGTPGNPESIRKHHDYDKVWMDAPNYPVIRAVRSMIHDGYYPIFVSGRPDSCRDDTARWINRHVSTAPRKLFMRRTGDHRPDYLVKYELFNEHVRDNYFVVAAFDDRDQVVNMYREIGITVFQVAPGNF
jgi:predicted kinase